MVLAPDADIFNCGRSLGNYFLKIILRPVIPTVINETSWHLFLTYTLTGIRTSIPTHSYSDINSDIYIYMLYCTIFLDIIPTVTVFGQIFWHVILQISCDIDSDMCPFTLTVALADVMWHIFWNTILHQLWHIFWNLLWPISCIFWHIRCSESGSLVSWSPHFLLVKSLQ